MVAMMVALLAAKMEAEMAERKELSMELPKVVTMVGGKVARRAG